jgi:hypothetical protein
MAKGDLSRDSIERRQKTFWVVGRVRLPAIDNERSTFLFRVLLVVTLVEDNMCPFLLRFSFYSLIQPTNTRLFSFSSIQGTLTSKLFRQEDEGILV